MSMAEKRRKLLASREAAAPVHPPQPPPAALKPLHRAPIMVLSAEQETVEAAEPVPTITVEDTPHAEATVPTFTVENTLLPVASVPTTTVPPRLQIDEDSVALPAAKIAPSRPAEQVGAVLDKLMQGLQTKGLSRRTLRVSIPYSLRLDRELFRILREGEGSAASRVLEAFLAVPRDNLEAIAGAASIVSERRRRPSRGGLGQSGTVTVTLDGPASETLEVLARRSRLSCGAYLEGCVLIRALEQGWVRPEDLTV